MALSVKDAGSWVEPTNVSAKVSGSWVDVKEVFVKDSGNWVSQWTGGVVPPVVDYLYAWNFNNTVDPIKGAITWNGSAAFDSNGALTRSGTDRLTASTTFPLYLDATWSLCVICKEHGTDGSEFSYPISDDGSTGGIKFLTPTTNQFDITSIDWDTGSKNTEGPWTVGRIGIPVNNQQVWFKLLITSDGTGNITMTANGTDFFTSLESKSMDMKTLMGRTGGASYNFEGSIAWLGVTDTVNVFGDFPEIADLPQTG